MSRYEEAARRAHKSGFNCAGAVYRAFADRPGITEPAPAPRSEGGKCGAYLAGVRLLEQLKPESTEEFRRRFREANGADECRRLIMLHGGRRCSDYVGFAAALAAELLDGEEA